MKIKNNENNNKINPEINKGYDEAYLSFMGKYFLYFR